MLGQVAIVDVNTLMNLGEVNGAGAYEGRTKQCGPQGLPYRTSKDDVCKFVFKPTLLELPEDFDAENEVIDLVNLKRGPGSSSIGVYRSQGETNITGNHKFEAMDMGKSSVTNFTLLI